MNGAAAVEGKFHWDNPLRIERSLSEDERLVRDIHALILGRAQTGIRAFTA